MKVVKVEILPMNAGEVVTATITVEGEGGYTNNVESGTPQASQTLTLTDDQKVTIEGKVQDEVQFNLDQRAAVKVPLGEKAEEQKKKDEEQDKKFEEMNKKEAERLEKEMPEEMKLRKAQEKERDEKIMGKPPGPPTSNLNTPIPYSSAGPNHPNPSSGVGQRSEPKDAGLRHETPADSKTVKEEGSTTKSKR